VISRYSRILGTFPEKYRLINLDVFPNTTLKTKLASLEQTRLDQKAVIDKKFENEKLMKKAYEEKEADFRAEILKKSKK
jgi:hypothetical protein